MAKHVDALNSWSEEFKCEEKKKKPCAEDQCESCKMCFKSVFLL